MTSRRAVPIALPNTQSLVGQSFHHQMLPFEFDLSFAITAITSTNALTAAIGALNVGLAAFAHPGGPASVTMWL